MLMHWIPCKLKEHVLACCTYVVLLTLPVWHVQKDCFMDRLVSHWALMYNIAAVVSSNLFPVWTNASSVSLCSHMNIVPVVTFYKVRDHCKVQMNGYTIDCVQYLDSKSNRQPFHGSGFTSRQWIVFVFLRHLFHNVYVYSINTPMALTELHSQLAVTLIKKFHKVQYFYTLCCIFIRTYSCWNL